MVAGFIPWVRPPCGPSGTPEHIHYWAYHQTRHKNEPLLECRRCGLYSVGELRYGTLLSGRLVKTNELFFRLSCPECGRKSLEASSTSFVAEQWNRKNLSWWERVRHFFSGGPGRLSV